jgi:biotin carboxylase
MATLLVIGSGEEVYRKYIVQSLSSRHSLALLQEQPISWQAPYIKASAVVDISDYTSVRIAAQHLHRKHRFDGIFTYEENAVELTAMIAEQLQLNFSSVETAQRCRDKRLMRQTWAQAGVPSARSELAESQEAALAAAREIGYPVVLKPRSLAASIGVVRVDSAAELAESYDIVSNIFLPKYQDAVKGVLVEEYLDGPEVSVESVVVDGQPHVVAITRKRLGFAPHFEEIGHVVAPAEPLPEIAAIHEVVRAAHHALGVRVGVTHAELRLTPSGPRMIELAIRLGGDMIPHLAHLATGVDLAAGGGDVAAGQIPELTPTKQIAAGVKFIYPERNILIKRVQIDSAAVEKPWIDQLTWIARAGEEYRAYPRGLITRLGFAIACGDTIAECDERLDQSASYMRIDA